MNSISMSLLFAIVGASSALAAGPADLVAHEWGTFTSLQGSNGKVVEGLQHEEEALPSFVYSRNRIAPGEVRPFAAMSLASTRLGTAIDPPDDSQTQPQPQPRPHPCWHCKGFEGLAADAGPLSVTQKLETPVIYFYTSHPQRVNVNVEFPQGVISQWYPNAESFRPNLGESSALEGGSMSWTVDLAGNPLALPFVSENNIWAPSRHVHSSYLRVGSENERFIFYRGLGHFDVPFEASSTSSGGLAAANQSEQPIPAAFLLHVEGNRGSVKALGTIAAHGAVNVASIPAANLAMDDYVAQAKTVLKDSLVQTGLYADEAQAMVDTWSRSYFRTPGVRILYVVPREWTDRLLPLRLSPQPAELVRTLVGRVEIFTAAEERSLASALESAGHGGAAVNVAPFGRFAEARVRRALELTSDPAAHRIGERLITSLSAQ